MNILMAVASKHGSTREIALAIAQELRAEGHNVQLHNVEEAPTVAGFDTAIIGSAVYIGSWLSQAKHFVERNQDSFAGIPVWLFSSGPLGDPPHPADDPQGIDELMEQTGAIGHQTFVGKLDKSKLGLGERIVVRGVKAPEGDYRDWEAIRAWAHDIAADLESMAAPLPTPA